ncbi:MAG: hypothetical protein BWY74_01730 [Firmicutes bacterium ADurb.Bin419]|nr:MAG: hypothetical protein BWY74_01730 [Firmicutes bacterium ADurb.Bin419]
MGTIYNNEFENTKTSITEKDINTIEGTFKFNFPTDFRKHYLIYNGGRPKKHVFIDEDYEFIVGYFIPIKYGVNDRILERVLEIFRDDKVKLYTTVFINIFLKEKAPEYFTAK